MQKYLTALLLALSLAACDPGRRQQMMVASQDVAIRPVFAINPDGTADYTIFWGNDTVVNTSQMGALLSNGDSIVSGLELIDFNQKEHSILWTLPEGAGQQIRDHHVSLKINLKSKNPERTLRIHGKIFNGCVAFRYEMPIGKDSVTLTGIINDFSPYKEAVNDPGVYQSKRGIFLRPYKAVSAPQDSMSYTDWEMIYIWDKREFLDRPQIVINLER